MSYSPIHQGLSLRRALKVALGLGCMVQHKAKTGEVSVRHPQLSKGLTLNARKKDAQRVLVSALRQIERAA